MFNDFGDYEEEEKNVLFNPKYEISEPKNMLVSVYSNPSN